MKTLIKNARIVNEGKILEGDLLINHERIVRIGGVIEENGAKEIDAQGKYLIPGIIDDQVHFREPGFSHKATIYSESRAAAAGGVTSFMEMPNTKPATITQKLLDKKYEIAASDSITNYSFYMGVSNDNLEEALKTDPKNVCGLKVFMGSSTGNMLVDDENVLENIFSKSNLLIATHCEDEQTIRRNLDEAIEHYGEDIPFRKHPLIRTHKACYISSSKAVGLAKKYNTRLHILHITTEDEISLFDRTTALSEKRITSEVCVHHLYFDDSYYDEMGSKIKCNPAIKREEDKEAIFQAMLDNQIDIIATDHAPHTLDEKSRKYLESPSGLPLIQHSLNVMLDFYWRGKITLEKIVEKMCHAPADCFQVSERGYIRPGYFADLAILDLDKDWRIQKENILYKCGWSPFEGNNFRGKIETTFVNGQIVWDKGKIVENNAAQRLSFDRD